MSGFKGCFKWISPFQTAYNQFVQERGSTTSGRESIMCQLASAHDTFRDLSNNLKEGTKFYNDLTQVCCKNLVGRVINKELWCF